MESATENRDLNSRAYQAELVETGDVIQAQLVEALMQVQHYKIRYDHMVQRSRLRSVVGTAVAREWTLPRWESPAASSTRPGLVLHLRPGFLGRCRRSVHMARPQLWQLLIGYSIRRPRVRNSPDEEIHPFYMAF
ncbi:MAG: hypothetical protein R3E97_19425 [Candidatus Eisenbacteria bacterium]